MFSLGAPELLILLVILAVPAAIIAGVVVLVVKATHTRPPATGPSVAGAVPPGWHPDPQGQPGSLRFWDGSRWTDDTATR